MIITFTPLTPAATQDRIVCDLPSCSAQSKLEDIRNALLAKATTLEAAGQVTEATTLKSLANDHLFLCPSATQGNQFFKNSDVLGNRTALWYAPYAQYEDDNNMLPYDPLLGRRSAPAQFDHDVTRQVILFPYPQGPLVGRAESTALRLTATARVVAARNAVATTDSSLYLLDQEAGGLHLLLSGVVDRTLRQASAQSLCSLVKVGRAGVLLVPGERWSRSWRSLLLSLVPLVGWVLVGIGAQRAKQFARALNEALRDFQDALDETRRENKDALHKRVEEKLKTFCCQDPLANLSLNPEERLFARLLRAENAIFHGHPPLAYQEFEAVYEAVALQGNQADTPAALRTFGFAGLMGCLKLLSPYCHYQVVKDRATRAVALQSLTASLQTNYAETLALYRSYFNHIYLEITEKLISPDLNPSLALLNAFLVRDDFFILQYCPDAADAMMDEVSMLFLQGLVLSKLAALQRTQPEKPVLTETTRQILMTQWSIDSGIDEPKVCTEESLLKLATHKFKQCLDRCRATLAVTQQGATPSTTNDNQALICFNAQQRLRLQQITSFIEDTFGGASHTREAVSHVYYQLGVAYELGRAYQEGNQGGPDLQNALTHYFYAQHQGSAEAEQKLNTFFLGKILNAQHYVLVGLLFHRKGDDKNAQKWLEKAVEREVVGDHVALTHLTTFYYTLGKKHETISDYPETVKWFQKAVDKGYSAVTQDIERIFARVLTGSISNNIAALYHSGDQIKKNYVEAARWYLKAMREGSKQATENLGRLYDFGGAGITKNVVLAVQYFQQAIDKGETVTDLEALCQSNRCTVDDCYAIAEMYLIGSVIKPNLVEAKKWVNKAIEQGDVQRGREKKAALDKIQHIFVQINQGFDTQITNITALFDFCMQNSFNHKQLPNGQTLLHLLCQLPFREVFKAKLQEAVKKLTHPAWIYRRDDQFKTAFAYLEKGDPYQLEIILRPCEFLGMDEPLKQIEEFLVAVKTTPHRDQHLLLLEGMPGLGKTEVVKYMANKQGFSFKEFRLGSAGDQLVGQLSARIKDFFHQAENDTRPWVFLLDEIDAICPEKVDGNTTFHNEVITTLQKEITDLKGRPVAVVGATNFIREVKTAILSRAGNNPIAFKLPNKALRHTLLDDFFRYVAIRPQYLHSLAAAAVNWSPRQLKTYAQSLIDSRSSTLSEGEIKSSFARMKESVESDIATQFPGVQVIAPAFKLDEQSADKALLDIDAHLRTKLMAIYYQLSQPEKFSACKRNPFLLLYGPPGTGKTHCIRVLSELVNVFFFIVSPADFTGHDAKTKLRKLFQTLKNLDNPVLFIDEIDTLANDASAVEPLLVTETDGFQKANFVFIGATNCREKIAKRMLSRFAPDERVFVDLPNLTQRAQSFNDLLMGYESNKGTHIQYDTSLEREITLKCVTLGAQSEGLSRRAIVQLIDNCVREAIAKQLTQDRVIITLQSILNGIVLARREEAQKATPAPSAAAAASSAETSLATTTKPETSPLRTQGLFSVSNDKVIYDHHNVNYLLENTIDKRVALVCPALFPLLKNTFGPVTTPFKESLRKALIQLHQKELPMLVPVGLLKSATLNRDGFPENYRMEDLQWHGLVLRRRAERIEILYIDPLGNGATNETDETVRHFDSEQLTARFGKDKARIFELIRSVMQKEKLPFVINVAGLIQTPTLVQYAKRRHCSALMVQSLVTLAKESHCKKHSLEEIGDIMRSHQSLLAARVTESEVACAVAAQR